MGLGYLFLFYIFICGAVLTVLLLRAAWRMFRSTERRALGLIPLVPALMCAAAAAWVLLAVLREPPWGFHF